MDKKTPTMPKPLSSKRRTAIMVFALVTVAIALFIIFFKQPKRSAAAYCKVYKEEKARLTKLPGDTYSSAVFDESLSDAGEFATSFSKLEKVAPDEIRPDIATLQSIYKKMHDDPSQALSASLSGISAESNVKNWIIDHCRP